MNEEIDRSAPSLPVSKLLEIDKICRQFEAAWKAGREPQVEDFLARAPEPQRDQLRRELESIDAEFRKPAQPAAFDPYYQWLGIPPKDQPADHYRLLGVERFEQNLDAIDNAAERQAMLLRTIQTPQHADFAQKLLNEVTAAKVCLLQPAKKAVYDHKLREQLASREKAPVSPHAEGARGAETPLAGTMRSMVGGRGAGASEAPLSPGGRGAGGEGEQPKVKILDLGLAMIQPGQLSGAERITASGQAMGTIDYMAPEQAESSRTVDIRADLYSLGCTLYKLLSGHAPFSGPKYEDQVNKLLAHAREPVPPIRKLRPDVPAELAAVLDRLLAKDPAGRFAAPADLVQAIAPFAAGSNLPELSAKARNAIAGRAAQAKAAAASGTHIETLSNIASPSQSVTPLAPSGRGAGGEGAGIAKQRLSSRLRGLLPPRFRVPGWAIAAAGGGAALILLAVILYVSTNHGLVKIELSDPKANVEVKVDGDAIAISGLGQPLQLKVGAHGLLVTSDQFETVTQSFAVRRGDITPLRITLLPKAKVAEKPEPKPTVAQKPPPVEPPKPRPAVYAVTVDPPQAKVSVAGKGASIAGGDATRTITVTEPDGQAKVTVVATLAGYERLEQEIQPKPGEPGRLTLRLKVSSTAPPEMPSTASASSASRAAEGTTKQVASSTTVSEKEIAVDLGGGVKLEMVLIPAGEFLMGSPESDKDAKGGEKPQRQVRITKPFYLGKYLVTQEQWEAVMGDGGITLRGSELDTSANTATVGARHFPNATPSAYLSGLHGPEAVAFDANGVLYVVNEGGGKGTTVSKFAPGSTTASATLIGLSQPLALAFDGSGNLYVANGMRCTVSKFAPGATTPTATLTGLNRASALAFDAGGNLYVANERGNTVSKFAPGGTAPISTLTGFRWPSALAFDKSDNLYVANRGNATVSKFAPGSTTPSAILYGVRAPHAMAFDAHGNLYVADSSGTTVSKFAPGGTAPIATLSGLNYPSGLAFDAGGNLYVTNGGRGIGGTLSIFVPGSTTPAATLTGLSDPRGLAFDGTGKLYVTNHGNGGGTTVAIFGPVDSTTSNAPVGNVNWADCQRFLEKLSARVAGRRLALPTEAQWEYACRAGSTTRFCFGDQESQLGEYAWYNDNSGGATHPVGTKKPNAWGLYDMHGNVLEWCADWYDGGYYANSPLYDPTGPSGGSDRVTRGGSWNRRAWDCRSAYRNAASPESRAHDVGFRVALAPAETPGERATPSATGVSRVQSVLQAPNPRSLIPPHAVSPFDEKKAREHQEAWAKHLGVPVEETNSIGMKLTLIPPGEFDMGSASEEIALALSQAKKGGFYERESKIISAEGPQHRVKIDSPFYLGMYVVTQSEYKLVMGANPSRISAKEVDQRIVPDDGWGRHPVNNVSREDALNFCGRLCRLPNEQAARRTYRLPKECEWEYACRAGTTTRWPFGDDPAMLGEYAWFENNSQLVTHPVGEKKPNAWGLYDMLGAVWQYCSDWHDADSNGNSSLADSAGYRRFAVRGGSWVGDATHCRCAYRNFAYKSPPDHPWLYGGLRVVAEIPRSGPAAPVPDGSRNPKREVENPKSEAPPTPPAPRAETGSAQSEEAKVIREIERLGGTVTVHDDGRGTWVGLSGAQVTDAALERLNGLAHLVILDLSRTRVTDAGLEHLMGLTELRSLYLSKTRVTDVGLEQLKALTGLASLHLDGCKVSYKGVGKLQRALPHCKIKR